MKDGAAHFSGARRFEVGDRVRVYGLASGSDGGMSTDQAWRVVSEEDSGWLRLRLEGMPKAVHEWTHIAHKKQCRRLVKKERRRVWCWREGYDNNEGPYVNEPIEGRDLSQWIEFVEVKRK